MSEIRYRANMLSSTVDQIEIVNETDSFVDVRYDRSYGDRPAHTIRREAKETAYSRICTTKEYAWLTILRYAEQQEELAIRQAERWRDTVIVAKKARADAQQAD